MLEQTQSMTAKICAFARAYHSNTNEDKIFDDYLAFDLMGKEGYEKIEALIRNYFPAAYKSSASPVSDRKIWQIASNFIEPIPVSRLAFAETQLAEFISQNGSCQYVICGAGFDTYSFRNANPLVQTFEIDHQNTQRAKLKRIKELEWHTPDNVH